MTPIISIYPGESVEHNWASTGERAWWWCCCCWDLEEEEEEEEGMLVLISFADCFPDSGRHWSIGVSVQRGGVCVCVRESQPGGVFLWVYNRVWAEKHGICVATECWLSNAIGWLFHRGVNFTLGPVCEARHTRLLACTHVCVVSSDQRGKLNERSWERAGRVWSKTRSHACLMKWG